MKFSNTIKTVLKIYQKYVKNSVWFGTGRDTRVLPHAKMLLVPIFFSFSLTGRLCSGGKRFD